MAALHAMGVGYAFRPLGLGHCAMYFLWFLKICDVSINFPSSLNAFRKCPSDLMQACQFCLQEGARVLKHLKSEEKEVVDSDKVKRRTKYVKPVPENYRRSKNGAKLIRQEMRKLLDDEKKMFPHKAMISADGETIRYSKNGQTETILLSTLLERAPSFFSSYYHLIRRKVDYGLKVHTWFITETRCLNLYFHFASHGP